MVHEGSPGVKYFYVWRIHTLAHLGVGGSDFTLCGERVRQAGFAGRDDTSPIRATCMTCVARR